MRKYLLVSAVIAISLLSGCASVPMESALETATAKEFNAPEAGNAGIYVYRSESHFGAALKKDIWIDSECIGETAKGIFFYHEVEGNKEHVISTESEFSPNDLALFVESGRLYFIQQFIKFGAFVGGAGLEQKTEQEGKESLANLQMAKKGTCNSAK